MLFLFWLKLLFKLILIEVYKFIFIGSSTIFYDYPLLIWVTKYYYILYRILYERKS